jgi:hypothetical protein
VGDWDEAPTGFAHTVLVGLRARLRASGDPKRISRVVAAEAGLIGLKRALDSAPLFDAAATQDTVTLVRSAIRGLLGACPGELEREMRAVLARADDYRAARKPPCDWADAEAREALVDTLARDGYASLAVLESRELTDGVAEAAELLVTVIGQDIEQRADGACAIARRVAPHRVSSTVDPEARHGRKTASQRLDGYKGHVACDPDSEIITDTAVTAANTADAEVTEVLLSEFADADEDADRTDGAVAPAGADPKAKTQPATAPAGGGFSKEDFGIDLAAATVTCPAGATATISFRGDGSGTATFRARCHGCPLRAQGTTAETGRTITITRHEQRLADQRARQRDPAWQTDYQANRPKVERKLGHLVRRWHGGRRARMRGRERIAQDWQLLADAHNPARMAVLGVHKTVSGWQTTPPERGAPGVIRPPPRPPRPPIGHRRRDERARQPAQPTPTDQPPSRPFCTWPVPHRPPRTADSNDMYPFTQLHHDQMLCNRWLATTGGTQP